MASQVSMESSPLTPGPLVGEQLVGTYPIGVVVRDRGDDQLVRPGGVTEPLQLVRDLARSARELGVNAVGDQLAVGFVPHVAPGFVRGGELDGALGGADAAYPQ